MFVDAVLWLACTASRGRDRPPDLGNWRGVHCCFRCWTQVEVWDNPFKAITADPDLEHVLIEAAICKVHADATSQNGGLKLMRSAGPAAG